MSIMTIPADVYRSILHDTHTRYVRHGMTGPEAAANAQQLMESAFRCAADLDEDFDQSAPEAGRW